MVDVAAAVLADDIDAALAVHCHAFVRLVLNGQRIASIGHQCQRAQDVAGAVHVADQAGFLAEDQQVASLSLTRQGRQVREGEDIGHVVQARQRWGEKIGGVYRGGRTVGGGASGEVNRGLEQALGIGLFREQESAGLRIIGQTFQADVANGRAELNSFRTGIGQGAASDISELHCLADALLSHHELAAADVSDAFGVQEIATVTRQRHCADQRTGLGDFRHGRAAVADHKERVSVPVVSHARGFLAQQVARRCRGACWFREVIATNPHIAGKIDVRFVIRDRDRGGRGGAQVIVHRVCEAQ